MTDLETPEIVCARPEELAVVRGFYYDLIDAMAGAEYSPKWTKEVYPTEADLREHMEEGNLFLGYREGRLAAAMVVNHDFNEGYEGVTWLTEGDEEEIWALHLLGVMPADARRGLGRAMVRRALALVRERGGRSLRLDVIKGNLPAERLYESTGFRHVGQARLFYEDTGWADFIMMEHPL